MSLNELKDEPIYKCKYCGHQVYVGLGMVILDANGPVVAHEEHWQMSQEDNGFVEWIHRDDRYEED